MILDYSIAWGIVKWRRGSTRYFNSSTTKVFRFFIVNILVVSLALVFAYQARIIATDTSTTGVLFMIFIWEPINASSDQLLWIYLFEVRDLLPAAESTTFRKFGFKSIGMLLFTSFVGMIHVLF